MTAPRKPRAVTPPPAELTADQLRIAQLFAAMDEEAQAPMLEMMEAMAASRPRRARPTLRLVGGGAS